MKWIKKELDKIPYKPYPAKCKPERKPLVLLAERADYQGTEILVATFYRVSTKQPFCRVFIAERSYTTKMCEAGRWSSATLNGFYPDGDRWNLTCDYYIHETHGAIAAVTEFIGDKYRWAPSAIDKIYHHQDDIARDKKIARELVKEQKDKAIIEEAFAQLPPLPKDLERRILDGPLAHSRYMFFRHAKAFNPLTEMPERVTYGFCSHCMKEYELEYEPKHRERGCWCPECQCEATAYKRWVSRKYMRNTCEYAVFTPAGENVFARFFIVVRDYNCDPEHITTRLHEVERYYFKKGAAYKITKYYANIFGNKYIGDEWLVKKCWEDMSDYEIYPYAAETFKGTVLEHAHLDDYIKQASDANMEVRPMQYLARYCQEPSIEHLIGAGLIRLVQARVLGDIIAKRSINWQAKRPKDMLGLSQPEVEQLKAFNFSCAEFEAYKFLKPAGVTLNSEEERNLISLFAGYAYNRDKDLTTDSPISFAKRWGVKETVRYLRYQYRKAYTRKTGYYVIWSELKDYHKMAKELGYDLSSQYYLFPHDLKKAHDKAAVLQLKQKELEAAEKARAEQRQWDTLYESLKELEYSNGELLIRPARVREELNIEGSVQKHCIAGYADRMLRGESVIWFIRKVDQPNTPYYALNTKPAPSFDFIQCHGYRNDFSTGGTRPQEIQDFEAEWYEKVVKPWQRKQEREKIKVLHSNAKSKERVKAVG